MQSQTELNIVVGPPESLDGDPMVIRRIRMRDSESDYTPVMDMKYKRLTDFLGSGRSMLFVKPPV